MKSSQNIHKIPKENKQHIQVFVRVRPPSSQDKQRHMGIVVECPSNKEVVVKDKPFALASKTFTFDRVFDTDSKQMDIYKHVVNPLIEEVLAGYNCTVFAYGQTGTGKTFTMEGEKSLDTKITWDKDPLSGIIPRTLNHLFDELEQQEVEFTIRVSFLELYNEELIDLLSPANDCAKIRIFEDISKKGSVIIQGLEEITVHSKEDVYQILSKGSEKRQTAATLMNANSSRSHTVFSITIHIKENLVGGDELLKIGKLNLVDLAGSENIGRSGAVDKRAREAGNINQSLLTLGRVITSLVERAPHIPYRESKLTRLLQDSLGGRTKTCFIATISAASSNLEETLSTLDYAHRAKNITNRPEINQKLTKTELLKGYTEEIERLRRDLLVTREKSGVYLDPSDFQMMTMKMSKLEQENSDKLARIKALREEMEKLENLYNDLNIQVEKKNAEFAQTTEVLVETEFRLKHTETKLMKTIQEREINEHLANHHAEKERLLGEQARTLKNVADMSTSDLTHLHDKLARKRSIEEGNKSRTEQFKENFHRNFVRMDDWLEKLLEDSTMFCGNLRSALGEQQDRKISELSIMSEHLTNQVQVFTEMLHHMEIKSAEAMRQAQYWIQHHLGSVRTTTGASAEALRTAMNDLISPPLQGMMQLLHEHKLNIQELSSQVNDEIREREHRAEVYSVETMDAINSLEESVTQYALQQKQEIEWLQTASQNYLEDSHTERKEMQTQLQAMQEMLDRMHAFSESKQQRANLTAAEFGEGLNRCKTSSEKFSLEMKNTSESLTRKQENHIASQKKDSEKLLRIFAEFVDKSNSGLTNTQNLREEVVSSCWTAVNSNEDAWREQYHATEEELRSHSEMLNRYLKSENEQTQALTNKVRENAEFQESLLESQRNSFRSFVQQRQEELEEECSSIRERGQVLSDELRKRDSELNYFFVNELVEDRPTGETPPRRDYAYPRRLVASSPRERVIQRALAQMDASAKLLTVIQNDNADDKKEEIVEKLSTSTKSLPEIAAQPETRISSETSVLQRAVSESNIVVPILDSTLENQVENQENMAPVVDHKKNSSQVMETQRRRVKYRKPLLSKNSER